MRKLILWMTALVLLTMTCLPAFASEGDRVLIRLENGGEDEEENTIETVLPSGNGFCIVTNSTGDYSILRYADRGAAPERFDLDREELETRTVQQGGVEEESYFLCRWFGWKDEIYALVCTTSYRTDDTREMSMGIRHARLEDGRIRLEDSGIDEPDLSYMIEYGPDDEPWLRDTEAAFTSGNRLVVQIWNEEGGVTLYITDLETGKQAEFETQAYTRAVPGPEGTILVNRMEENRQELSCLDPDSQTEKPVGEIASTGLNGLICPCYDPETDQLYYVRDGEVWAAPYADLSKETAVNDCPVTGSGALTLPEGFLLVWSRETAVIRNTDPAQRGGTVLRIRDNGYSAMDEAICDPESVPANTSLVLVNGTDEGSGVLQAMLNRDGTTDVYVLQYDSNEFQALLSRDYLPDLSANPKIAVNAERLYPYLREAFTRNGKIIGVPVSFIDMTIGIDAAMWKALGGTEEELPRTWNGFFDWLETLPEKFEGQEVLLIGSWEDNLAFRATVLDYMLQQYEMRMRRKEEKDYTFNTPELCALVDRLNRIDYQALRVAENNGDDSDDGFYISDEMSDYQPLLNLRTSVIMDGDMLYTPLPLGFAEDEPGILPVEISVAFVNPFSAHPQEAMEFLAAAMEKLTVRDLYAAYTDRTEPIRIKGYEDRREASLITIREIRKKLENDEADNPAEMRERLEEEEQYLEEMDRCDWVIKPETIDFYRNNQDACTVKSYSFFNDLFGDANGEDGYELYDRYFCGPEAMGIDPAEMLGMLDQKVRMIRMERN